MGGNHVHPLIHSHICQHGIIEDQAHTICGLGDHQYHQKSQPFLGYGKRKTPDYADHKKSGEHGFLIPFCVRQGSEHRTHERYQDGTHRQCIA